MSAVQNNIVWVTYPHCYIVPLIKFHIPINECCPK